MSALPVHYRLRCLENDLVLEDDGLVLEHPARRGALLRAVYETSAFRPCSAEPGLFRYRHWLPVRRSLPGAPGSAAWISDGLGPDLGLDRLCIAFSGYWPERGADLVTGTFKELEAWAVLARLPEDERRSLVVSSAGSTGRAFLEVASRLGVPVTVVVPERALADLWTTRPRHPAVRLVALEQGADYLDAIRVGGALAALPGFVAEGGARNVARRDGMGTPLLAAAEALGELPRHYVQAVGSGTGGIAAWEMAERLRAAGAGTEPCALHLVQNAPFTPMTDAWRAGAVELPDVPEEEARRRIDALHAFVLSNRRPPWSVAGGVRDALVASEGSMDAVTRAQAVEAGRRFERLEGIDVHPAAEVAVAGLIRAVADGRIRRGDPVVLHVTGGGLGRVGPRLPATPDVRVSRHIEPDALAALLEDR